MIDHVRLTAALARVQDDLLRQQNARGHWVGALASSALSTATAISALAVCRQAGASDPADDVLIERGLKWLVAKQNPDGGWGDTDQSFSNISTTLLVRAALQLAGVAELPAYSGARAGADAYALRVGGIAAVRRRYGKDKTFAVPILANLALAGLAPWQEVSALPFELACFPQKWFGALRLPVVSYAIPALVAIGQARFVKLPPRFLPLRWLRRAAVARSLRVLERMQPSGGGFLEATPLTSFVCMSLDSIGQSQHHVVRRGMHFIRHAALADGSWPIDTNLATWVTTLAVNALGVERLPAATSTSCLDWILSCQMTERHPYTGAAPGGWGWSDLSGSVPDADDTPGALLALAKFYRHQSASGAGLNDADRTRVVSAAGQGIRWLLDLQNGDGGWPTFCKGWGALPFDRSGTDLTAHALRALHVWEQIFSDQPSLTPASWNLARATRARERGLAYLRQQQRGDGSWLPLWFGNQHRPDDINPIYGTARVLLVYRDLQLQNTHEARRGLAFLAWQQHADGGWGNAPSGAGGAEISSVEESALALEAIAAGVNDPNLAVTLERGLFWLVDRVEACRHQEMSPIGFYFAKLWYYERLYPLVFTAAALEKCQAALVAAPEETAAPV